MSGTGTVRRGGIGRQISMRKTWKQRTASAFFGMMLGVLIPTLALGADATLLPNAKQQYLDDAGNPVASGSVGYYIPSTSTKKTVWQDAGKATPQTNPVPLDAAGRPQPGGQTYGDGLYRQVVKDANNLVIWDATTTSTGSGSGGGGIPSSEGVMVGTIILWTNTTLPAQYLYTAGQAVSRTTYSALLTAITYSIPVLCQSGIASISVPTAISDNTPIGAAVEASCLVPGTVVASKNTGQLTLSTSATATVSVNARIFPWGDGDRSTTFNVPDSRGRVFAGRGNMGGVSAGRLTTPVYGTNPDASGAVGGNQTTTLDTPNLPPYTPSGVNGSSTSSGLFLQGGASDNFASITGSGQFNNLTKANVVSPGPTFFGTAQGGISTPLRTVQPTVTADYIIKAFPDDSPTGPGVSSIGGMTGVIACGSNITCTANTISLGNFGNGLPLIGQGLGQPIGTGTVTGTDGSTRFVTADSSTYIAGNCGQWVSNEKMGSAPFPCGTGTTVANTDVFHSPGDFTPGVTTSLTVPNTPTSQESTFVIIDGSDYTPGDTWTLSGSTINFTTPIQTNVQTIVIRSFTPAIIPTWVTAIVAPAGNLTGNIVLGNGLSASGQTINATIGDNLLNNSSFGLNTLISTVLVSATPTTPQAVPITGFSTVGGANSNAAQFGTSGSVGPNGVGGLTPGKLVAILGSNHAAISFTATVTGGTTITATAPVFSQSQGDIFWITGGTNTSPRTQFKVVSTTGGGTILTVNGALVNEASKTFTAQVIQGGYAIDPTVNGMPQAGNPYASAFYYYPLQVSAIGTNVFNASMAGYNLNAGTSSAATAWEVTNGVQGTGSPAGPDWWLTTSTLSWYKMRGYDWDGITIVNKPGELYSVKIVKGSTAAEDFYYDLTATNPAQAGQLNASGLAQFKGKTVDKGGYLWCDTASVGRLFIDDGITRTYSAYATPGSFQWVEISATLSASATAAKAGLNLGGGVSGKQCIYTQPMAVLGKGPIGEGNYKRAPWGFKMFYNHINPFYYIGRTVPVSAYINIEQETLGLIPTGFGSIQSDVEAYNSFVLTQGYLTNNQFQEMSALTFYNQTISTVKNVNTGTVGVGTRMVQDGTFSFWQDTHFLHVDDARINLNIDYYGGNYQ